MTNIDNEEVAKFSRLAADWWEINGQFKTLHAINPARFQFIADRMPLTGQRVLDVGCGGGILTETLARAGAQVVGIDMSEAGLQAARYHAGLNQLEIEYRCIAAESLAEQQPQAFDGVVCMELLEHVPDPASLIKACATLCKPGGHLFFSTLNRTLKSYLYAVIGAEYLLKLLPRGTHDYAKFIQPAELATWLRQAGAELKELQGLHYNPLNNTATLSADVQVNYLAYCGLE